MSNPRAPEPVGSVMNRAESPTRPPDPAVPANNRSIDVAAAWAGLVGVVLFVVGSLLAGSPPKPDASAAEITRFLVQQRSGLLQGTGLILASIPFFGCFVGIFTGVLHEAEGGRGTLARAATLGWTLQFAVVAIGILSQAALTWRGAAGVDPHLVQFAYDLGTLSLYAVSATAVALAVGATSIVIFRTGVLPRWLVALGAVEVVLNLVELAGLASRRGMNAAGYAAGVGPLVWSLWAAAASVCLARHLSRTPDGRPRRG
jgi:hypothetical protein